MLKICSIDDENKTTMIGAPTIRNKINDQLIKIDFSYSIINLQNLLYKGQRADIDW